MRRPRFLTALAVGAFICGEYGSDTVAADGVTAQYLVFEWWVVVPMESSNQYSLDLIDCDLVISSMIQRRRWRLVVSHGS
jgi:hypothetical protein